MGLEALIIVGIIFAFLLSNLDSKDQVQFSNDSTFTGFDELLMEGHLYKIVDRNGMALTSNPSDKLEPSIVTASPWKNTANQYWEVHHVDDAIILTPLRYDFNRLTYRVLKNAEAHVIWNLGRPGVEVSPEGMTLKHTYMLRNSEQKCLKTFRLSDLQYIVDTTHCQPWIKDQYWTFELIRKNSI